MIDAMPRPRPPHLRLEKTRHGRRVWYLRLGNGPRIRIKGEYGTPEFEAAYQAALRGEQPASVPAARSGSLAWLISRYREVGAWRSLSPATRRQRENIFKHVIRSAGTSSYRDITKATIVAGRDRRAATPAQARHFLHAMRGLFAWAVEAELVKHNPTEGAKDPKRPKTGGFPVWSEDDVERYCARWPLGTEERVWLDVLPYTGLAPRGRRKARPAACSRRRCNASHRKEQDEIRVTIPILPVLARTLAAGPCGELAFIVGEHGKPLTKSSAMRSAMRVEPRKQVGAWRRKIGATRAANNGATVAELEAIFGWIGGRMASLYTQAADRARLARRAIDKLANENRTSIAAPMEEVRHQRKMNK